MRLRVIDRILGILQIAQSSQSVDLRTRAVEYILLPRIAGRVRFPPLSQGRVRPRSITRLSRVLTTALVDRERVVRGRTLLDRRAARGGGNVFLIAVALREARRRGRPSKTVVLLVVLISAGAAVVDGKSPVRLVPARVSQCHSNGQTVVHTACC